MSTDNIVAKTGNPEIDGMLMGRKWENNTVTYSFPDSLSDFPPGSNNYQDFRQAPSQFQDEFRYAANLIEKYTTDISFQYAGTDSADITVFVISGINNLGAATGPGIGGGGSSIFLSSKMDWVKNSSTQNGLLTALHELGHIVGLKHPHEAWGDDVALPQEHDCIQYTVMTYRGYPENSDTSGHLMNMDVPSTY